MIVVGLTGGIATGKSSVTALLRHHGLTVLDCDEIAHAVVRQVAALPLAMSVCSNELPSCLCPAKPGELGLQTSGQGLRDGYTLGRW